MADITSSLPTMGDVSSGVASSLAKGGPGFFGSIGRGLTSSGIVSYPPSVHATNADPNPGVLSTSAAPAASAAPVASAASTASSAPSPDTFAVEGPDGIIHNLPTADRVARIRARWNPDGTERVGLDYANAYQSELARANQIHQQLGLPTSGNPSTLPVSAVSGTSLQPPKLSTGPIDIIRGGHGPLPPGQMYLGQAAALAELMKAQATINSPVLQAQRRLMDFYRQDEVLQAMANDPNATPEARAGAAAKFKAFQNNTATLRQQYRTLGFGLGGVEAQMFSNGMQ